MTETSNCWLSENVGEKLLNLKSGRFSRKNRYEKALFRIGNQQGNISKRNSLPDCSVPWEWCLKMLWIVNKVDKQSMHTHTKKRTSKFIYLWWRSHEHLRSAKNLWRFISCSYFCSFFSIVLYWTFQTLYRCSRNKSWSETKQEYKRRVKCFTDGIWLKLQELFESGLFSVE